MTIMQYIT